MIEFKSADTDGLSDDLDEPFGAEELAEELVKVRQTGSDRGLTENCLLRHTVSSHSDSLIRVA
jgi:hypothetical protein